MAVAFKEVNVVDTQGEERSGFEIEARLSQSTSLEESEVLFLECEKIIEDFRRRCFGRGR